MDGPYLRYAEFVDDDDDDDDDVVVTAKTPRYYRDENLAISSRGTAKREGWDGSTFAPRVLCGGVHYYLGDAPVLDAGWSSSSMGMTTTTTTTTTMPNRLYLPGVGWTTRDTYRPTSSPSVSDDVPTMGPSISASPSTSMMPSASPTDYPTIDPTDGPTHRPTLSPLEYGYLSTYFETSTTTSSSGGAAMIYAGNMFDIKARSDVEISSLGFNTYWTSQMNVEVYFRYGGYQGQDDDDMSDWTYACNVTVMGMGIGVPTYVPYGSFEPILLGKKDYLGVYISTDGPYLLSSLGELEGKPHVANPYLVLYEGCGKRRPLGSGTYSPRIFNGVIGYNPVTAPTNSPTMDVSDLWIANITLESVSDTYVERDNDSEAFGESAQLMVDGGPERVALLQFDLSSLLGGTENRPDQVLGAKLRLYSMTSMSMYGGRVSVILDGSIDEDTTTWDDCDYAEKDTGIYVGSFRAVWPGKFYEIDLTSALRSSVLPTSIVVRIGSEGGKKAVMYRSRDGGGPNVPLLTITFAYDPDVNRPLARAFGSDPPTFAPTVLPVWDDAPLPPSDAISSTYFNYNPNTSYGPDYWEDVEQDGYYDQLRRLDADTSNNRCSSGDKQSPRDLCDTNDECVEFHMPRPRRGDYGLRDESLYRPTPMIMHNKLRLSYPERRSEEEFPEPPGTDFAHNVFNSGVQDLVNIDIKVKSEHRLCGKQYDGEMQLVHVHGQEGNLEILSILIEAGGDVEGEMGYEDNPHFQLLLDYFQRKYDEDAGLCLRRRRRARALLFDAGRGGRVRRRGDGEDGNARSTTVPLVEPSSFAIEEDKIDDFANDRNEGMEDGRDDAPSLANYLYRKIHEKFESLVSRRRLASLDRWNPLEPWYVYRSIHFWGYSGSITEPPCFQGVNWRVLDVPMRISMRQYVQLKTLMFDHVDPDTCQKTSTHFEESNARPVQPWTEGSVYRCRRSDYASDMERAASGRRKGFVLEEKWWGVDNYPYITPEFPDAG
ncbi:hypothetical protein ACHAXA_009037 [Cyclostephanos tholiformis]|uniref:carbonic anhydrase n=1 Tax=Cyclostephanos tholiformis TaxID=382380 RepID=A0ABD3RY77_9STRA